MAFSIFEVRDRGGEFGIPVGSCTTESGIEYVEELVVLLLVSSVVEAVAWPEFSELFRIACRLSRR